MIADKLRVVPFVTVAMGLILIVPNHALLLYYASSLVYNTGNM